MTAETDLHTLVPAYLLDALSDEEQQHFEAHLARCEACALEVAELRPGVRYLQETADEVPPAGLRDRIVQGARSDRERSATPTTVTELPERSASSPAGSRWQGWLVAAAAAVLLVAVTGLSLTAVDLAGQRDEAQLATGQVADLLAAPDVALTAGQGADGVLGRVVVSASRGEAVVVTDGLAPPPPGRTYQLWVIDGQRITAAGLFDTDTDGRAIAGLTGELADGVVIGITDEPAGGSPQPTSDPVLAIELG